MSIHSTGLSAWEKDSDLLAWGEDVAWEDIDGGKDVKLLTWRGQYVIRPKVAFKLLNVGNTRGYELVNAGELESYLDGRARQITVRSVFRYIARRLVAARQLASNVPAPCQSPVLPHTKTPPLMPKRGRGRPRAHPENAGVRCASDE
jgi:hypothetical protein